MSRLARRTLGLAALLALVSASAWAGSDERKGTSGALELLIPVGARGSALGPAAASDIRGAEATFWNPAGLAGMEGSEAIFNHTEYFADMQVNYAAIAAKAGNLGVLGFNVKALSVGDIQVTTEAAPDGTGEVLQPTFTVMGVSWARAFTDRVKFGSTVNFVNEKVLSLSASGIALDFGVQYDTGWHGLQFAMTMKNFGNSMEFRGDNLEVSIQPPGSDPNANNRIVRFTTAAFEMPSYFTLSTTYDAFRQGDNALKLYGAFQNNNFFGDHFNAGGEWNYKNLFALRGSWFGSVTSQLDAAGEDESVKFTSGDDLYQGLALGAGLNVKAGGSKVGVDLSWRPVKEFFDDIIEVGVRVSF